MEWNCAAELKRLFSGRVIQCIQCGVGEVQHSDCVRGTWLLEAFAENQLHRLRVALKRRRSKYAGLQHKRTNLHHSSAGHIFSCRQSTIQSLPSMPMSMSLVKGLESFTSAW